MTYAEKLKNPLWQQKRLRILERDNWECQLCFDKETELHAHHFCYSSTFNPWDVNDDALITYCKCCHALSEKINETIIQINKFKINHLQILTAFLVATDYFVVAAYDETKRSIIHIQEQQYIYRNGILSPTLMAKQFTCKLCGNVNYNTSRCYLCGNIQLNNNPNG